MGKVVLVSKKTNTRNHVPFLPPSGVSFLDVSLGKAVAILLPSGGDPENGMDAEDSRAGGRNLGGYITTSVHTFLVVLASLGRRLLSLETQIFLTDAHFMAIIFTLQFFPGVPHECAGSCRELTLRFCVHTPPSSCAPGTR